MESEKTVQRSWPLWHTPTKSSPMYLPPGRYISWFAQKCFAQSSRLTGSVLSWPTGKVRSKLRIFSLLCDSVSPWGSLLVEHSVPEWNAGDVDKLGWTMKGAHRRGGARKRQWVLKLLLVGLEKKQWMWIFLEVQLRPPEQTHFRKKSEGPIWGF